MLIMAPNFVWRLAIRRDVEAHARTKDQWISWVKAQRSAEDSAERDCWTVQHRNWLSVFTNMLNEGKIVDLTFDKK